MRLSHDRELAARLLQASPHRLRRHIGRLGHHPDRHQWLCHDELDQSRQSQRRSSSPPISVPSPAESVPSPICSFVPVLAAVKKPWTMASSRVSRWRCRLDAGSRRKTADRTKGHAEAPDSSFQASRAMIAYSTAAIMPRDNTRCMTFLLARASMASSGRYAVGVGASGLQEKHP